MSNPLIEFMVNWLSTQTNVPTEKIMEMMEEEMREHDLDELLAFLAVAKKLGVKVTIGGSAS